MELAAYYGIEEDRNSLKHHGILGMKWGVKNGPPYPLSDDVSTGSKLKKWVKVRKDRGIDPKNPRSPESQTKAKVRELRVRMADMTNEEINECLKRLDIEMAVERRYASILSDEKAERQAKEDAKWYKPKNLSKALDNTLETTKPLLKLADIVDNYSIMTSGTSVYDSLGLGGDFRASDLMNFKSKKKQKKKEDDD